MHVGSCRLCPNGYMLIYYIHVLWLVQQKSLIWKLPQTNSRSSRIKSMMRELPYSLVLSGTLNLPCCCSVDEDKLEWWGNHGIQLLENQQINLSASASVTIRGLAECALDIYTCSKGQLGNKNVIYPHIFKYLRTIWWEK